MELRKAKIDSLIEFPNNPRKGNIEALAESLKVNGQYRPVVVRKETQEILAGNHLVKAASSLGWTEVDITEVDVDDEQAKKIVAADNRLADLGNYDEKALLELLENISLEGTGYVPADLDDLLAMLEESSTAEWKVAAPDAVHENVQSRPSLADRASHYAERTIRLLMCEFPNEQYIWVVERLTEIRKKTGAESNADAVIKVIEEYTGQTAPTNV